MEFFQKGTIAESMTHDTSLKGLDLSEFTITSTETFDTEIFFKQLSLQLDMLENQKTGTQEAIDHLTDNLSRLPQFSEERVECDIRIKSIKIKWGLSRKSVKPTSETISFPVEVEKMDAALIEKKHYGYINSGKAGRLWIQSWIKNQGIAIIPTEKKLNQLVEKAASELSRQIVVSRLATSKEEWEQALRSLGIQVGSNHLDILFENWLETKKERLVTIPQIQKWTLTQEKTILMNQGITSVLDSKLIDHVISSEGK